jgi:hypothetical protein
MADRPLHGFLFYILELPIGPFGRRTRDRKGVPSFGSVAHLVINESYSPNMPLCRTQ